MLNLLGKVLSLGEGKKLKKLQEKVQKVNDLESKVSALSDDELLKKTDEFKNRLNEGGNLDDILSEAFAVVREVAKRKINMRHFDVQIMGGIVLHEGKITEMATGEGKTLVATLPVYLNTLEGKGVHVVTVNDYLAKRDAQWMGPVYHFLGLSTSIIQHDAAYIYDPNYETEDENMQYLRPVSRHEAYEADVTYGTNNEFGFDYLRDNMALSLERVAQRGHHYAIVDEVDSILIDEARTPLIISGPAEDRSRICKKVEQDVNRMKWLVIAKESKDAEELDYNEESHDFIANEKENTLKITPRGYSKIARTLNITVDDISDPEQLPYGVPMLEWMSRYKQSMKAHSLFKKDVDYLVKDGQVVIVDDFTGRLMPGRRYSEGLHEAIEAKERVHIRQENQTLATITLQNYFRMYEKLAGMTGTAATEADEFIHIYGLETVVIPTNKPLARATLSDVIYKTGEAKFQAIVEDIIERYKKGQPILVGTISVEKSELLSKMLRRRGIEHEVLNAKYHEREAHIVAQAGKKGAITIATNMAGRGTDIVLGGNPPNPKEAEEVKNVGGLHVIGTGRHEARRIDNQLRGRSGRQGDPGSSQFYISLEDNLMRLFGGDRIGNIMQKLGLPDDMPIEHAMISKSVERAQREVESQNFNIRKHVLEYDDVMNTQREIIYKQRSRCLKGEDFHEQVFNIVEDVIGEIVEIYTNKNTYPEQWNLDGLFSDVSQIMSLSWGKDDLDLHSLKQEELHQRLLDSAKQAYQDREKELGSDILREMERHIMLQVVDHRWREQLYEIDYLKEGIGLRAIGQRDPLVEFKREAFEKWTATMHGIKEDFVRYVFHAHIVKEPRREAGSKTLSNQGGATTTTSTVPVDRQGGQGAEAKESVRKGKKIGRNEPCPCGSGKKYKKCCGI